MKNVHQNQKGAAMTIVVLFFVVIGVLILGGIIGPVISSFKVSKTNLLSEQSYFTAESGVEDVFYRIKTNRQYGNSETLSLGGATSTTSVTNTSSSQKQISSTGDSNSYQRVVGVTLKQQSGISFNYGVQAGDGGVNLTGSGTINGNIYSNGPITGDSSAVITGTAISANRPTASNQSNGTGVPAYDIIVGNSSPSDIGQSFKLSSTGQLNKIQLYLKKFNSPYNTTVYILPDNAGAPGFGAIAQGTLSAYQVATSYGWVDITFSSNPTLTASTTYWIVMSTTPGGGYYTVGGNDNGYSTGSSKKGAVFGSWSNLSPSTLDFYFSVFLSGINGSIAGSSGSQWNQLHVGTVSGTAQAHTVNYTNATGNIYCQSGTGNNKTCINQTDPAYLAMPISDTNITGWKTEAGAGGVTNGDYSVGWAGGTIGPRKIVGNLTVSGGGTLTVTGTIWVTGKVTLNGGGIIKLASSYGVNDGVIVSDNGLEINGGGYATGSGTAGSYIMMVSTKSGSAASVDGGAGAVIVYAPNGTLTISGGASLKEAVAYQLNISGGSSVTYESGLANLNFSSGPSGTWSASGWGETQ